MSLLKINDDICVLCKRCISACPYSALIMDDGKVRLIPDKCQMCGVCVTSCPVKAISFDLPKASGNTVNLDDYSGVWVFGEMENGELNPVVYELVGKGRELARRLRTELEVVVFSDSFDRTQLTDYDIDAVLFVKDQALSAFNEEVFANTLSWLVGIYKPEVILCGATAIGRSFLPRVATTCHTGLTADCTSLSIDDNRQLVQTRPAFGGNIMAEILCPENRPQMATVRSRVFPPAEKIPGKEFELTELILPERFAQTSAKRISYTPEEKRTSSIADAEIIISGGRGIGGREGFKLLEAAAEKIGAAVGASRAAVDLGWYPYSHQIGQTGKTVNPKIYIACGISGAVQHRIGISSADTIIAINSDPEAPICGYADYVVIGDWKQIITNLEQIISEQTA